MPEEFLAAYITSGAAIFVAILGFLGSIVISLRTSRAALKALRYERVTERRDTVLGTIYASLYDVILGLSSLKVAGEKGIDIHDHTALRESSEEANAVANKSKELISYIEKHAIWLSDADSNEIRSIARQANRLAYIFSEATIKEDKARRERVASEIAVWLQMAGVPHRETIKKRFQTVLGVDKE